MSELNMGMPEGADQGGDIVRLPTLPAGGFEAMWAATVQMILDLIIGY